MNKFIIALAATTAFVAAAPAAAQYGSGNFQLRTDQLQSELQVGVQNGTITRAEAMPIRERIRELNRLERQFAVGGFSSQERSELRSRIASVRESIRIAARTGGTRDGRWDRDDGRDRDDRPDRDGRWDRDDRDGRDGRYGRDCPPGLEKRDNGCVPPGQVGRDRDGRWGDDDGRYRRGDVIDRNRDGYDDRDLNRDNRVDDRERRMYEDRYGRDGDGRYERDGDRWDRDDDGRWDRDDERYEDRDRRRGGIGGVLDSVIGRGGLRVGQRVTADARLGPVPYEYRNQYRDGNGVYYRSDGRAIYQIDVRTNTVLQIYGMNR
jgi:hypothetical protein